MTDQPKIQSEKEADKKTPECVTPLLSRIEYPKDLRALPEESLPELCAQLRQSIIEHLACNPGHFASSMGAVELTVALHYVFNTPEDRLVWDVGHQTYAHKLLTGRRERFDTLRIHGGLSGFPTPTESEYDTFSAGHAGNSISAALGMAIADMNTPGHEDRKTVAIIGDASIGNGLAFEGLNNASNHPNNLLIILNDNDMSIDNNVGALHHYLTDITTSAGYNRWRKRIYEFFHERGFITDANKRRLLRLNNSLKAFISQQQNIFEGLNIRYFGPFDGHDVGKIVKVLREIKDMKGPRILHLHTTKGKGYAAAEKDPTTWHAPGKFNPATGERLKKNDPTAPPLWQEVFGETLVELADTHPEVVGITAAMPSGTSINKMMAKYPSRVFDVGISEGHAVTFAGGMASAGKHPFVAIYSSFLQRAYDNIVNDVAIQGLPVTFCIDRAGLVGEDGVTHHGLLDLAYLKCIPGMKIASPMDESTLRNLMYTSLYTGGPMAIRYPRGNAFTPDWRTPMQQLEPGRGRILRRNPESRIAILTLGPLGHEIKEIADRLEKDGITLDHYDMIWLKPLDESLLRDVAENHEGIITLEDGNTTGGFGSAVAEWLAANGFNRHLRMLGAPDEWTAQGTVAELRHDCGYDSEAIEHTVRELDSILTDRI